MKRWLVCLVGLGLLLLPKGQGTDVGKLQPAEVLFIYMEEGITVVKTDTGSMGKAWKLEEALADMKESTPAELFLDTVSYVLVTEETKGLLPQLGQILRPGTEVVLLAAPMVPENVAVFLKVHKPNVRLFACMVEQPKLPKLMTAGERWYLVQQGNE